MPGGGPAGVLPPGRARPTLERDARVALTVSPYVKSMAKIIAAHHRRYPNLRYLPQDLTTLGTLLYGDAPGRWRSSDCGPGAGARSARRYGAS